MSRGSNHDEAPAGSSPPQLDPMEELQFMCITKGLSRTLMAPLDRIKFLLQSQGELHRLGRIDRPFRGWLPCVQQVVTFEGVPGLFRGNVIGLVGILPTALSQAYVGMPTQRIVFDLLPHYTAVTYTIASLLSGLVSAGATLVLTYPFDFLRFRMAVDVRSSFHCPYEFRSSFDLLRHPSILDRPHNLYRGLGLYLAGSFFYRSMFNTSIQLVSPWMPTDEEADEDFRARAKLLACSFGAVSIGTVLLYPLDTIRRRMMLAVLSEEGQYHTVAHCMRTITRNEGLGGFFRGVGFTMFRGMVTTMFMFMTGLAV